MRCIIFLRSYWREPVPFICCKPHESAAHELFILDPYKCADPLREGWPATRVASVAPPFAFGSAFASSPIDLGIDVYYLTTLAQPARSVMSRISRICVAVGAE